MARVLKWPKGINQSTADVKPRSEFTGFLLKLFFPDSGINAHDKGLAGEQKVALQLARRLGDRWTIINDLLLGINGKKTQVDHLVFGPPGVFCVETKNWRTADCNREGDWLRFGGGMWVPQYSPVKQSEIKVQGIEEILGRVRPGIKVKGVIVFANSGIFDFSNASLPENWMVFGLPGLLEYLIELEKKEDLHSEKELYTMFSIFHP